MLARQKGLINQISDYITERKKGGEYNYFWGAFFGGFTQIEKLKAAEALLACTLYPIDNPVTNLIPHFEVLSQGSLAEYFSLYREFNPDKYQILETAMSRAAPANSSKLSIQ